MIQTVIETKNLTFAYHHGVAVLEQIDLTVAAGESVGVIGANGAGKSTLLKILVGLLTEYQGSVHVTGIPVTTKQLAAIREKTGYIFQDSDNQLFMSTVYEDVAFGPQNYGYDKKEVEERVTQALAQVHLEELRDRQIYRMSGGQKKLAAIATILAMLPEIVLFDEPSIALDPRNRRNLIHIINEMKATKVIASHDLDMILDTCERTILIEGGRIICNGDTKEILKNQDLLEAHDLELPLSLSGR